jgi:DNA-binding IclR family transcriptional regulator
MSETPLTERQARLLAVVAEGGGDWDARRIDLTASVRYGPGTKTVLRELEELQRLGLVARDDSRSGAGGRWTVTAAARLYLGGVPGHGDAAG